jgi:hypothetical protein
VEGTGIVTALVVYLDQNKWIELARARHGSASDSSVLKVLAMLQDAVSAGRVVLPLSGTHYLETWHRTSWSSRHDLARTMRDLSQYTTLAPPYHLLCLEVEGLLLRHFRGPECECTATDVRQQLLGRGVNHAFNSPTGRMRLVEAIATPDSEEGPPVRHTGALRAIHRAQELPNQAYEWWSLAGSADSLSYPDFEVRSEHRLGLERVERENELATRIASDSYLRHRLDDYLVAEELASAIPYINHVAYWHGAATGHLIDRWMNVGPEFGHLLLDLLPTRLCVFHMRRSKHRNPQWKWHQHDGTDLAALSSAVPYCDIVVTERQWAHVLRSADLGARFGTTVCSRLVDLVPILDATEA